MTVPDALHPSSEQSMTIFAYRVDDPADRSYGPEYICVACYEEGIGDDWYEGLRLAPITDPRDLPTGPPKLGRECDSPFCEERLPMWSESDR